MGPNKQFIKNRFDWLQERAAATRARWATHKGGVKMTEELSQEQTERAEYCRCLAVKILKLAQNNQQEDFLAAMTIALGCYLSESPEAIRKACHTLTKGIMEFDLSMRKFLQ